MLPEFTAVLEADRELRGQNYLGNSILERDKELQMETGYSAASS